MRLLIDRKAIGRVALMMVAVVPANAGRIPRDDRDVQVATLFANVVPAAHGRRSRTSLGRDDGSTDVAHLYSRSSHHGK